eukprot:765459-Hanusia_phi.AAC.2
MRSCRISASLFDAALQAYTAKSENVTNCRERNTHRELSPSKSSRGLEPPPWQQPRCLLRHRRSPVSAWLPYAPPSLRSH